MTPDPAPLVDVADLVRLVGRVAFDRGRGYARDGRVTSVDWNADKRRVHGIVEGSTDIPYACIIDLGDDSGGIARIEGSACSCPLRGDCKHIVATLLQSNAAHLRAEGRSDRWVAPQRPPAEREASWRSDRRWTAPINDPVLDEPAEHRPMYADDELEALPEAWRPAVGQRPSRWAPSPPTPPEPPTWRNRLDSLTGEGGRAVAPTAMGLQFEVRESIPRTAERWRGPTSRTADGPPDPRHPRRIAVRPVVRKAGGGFVKSTISWTSFTHQGHRLALDPAHQQWFTQFQALLRATRPPAGAFAGAGDADWLVIDDFGSPVLWHLLEEASQLGIELVGTRKGTVALGATAAVRLDAAHAEGGVVLRPVVTIDGTDVDASTSGAIGDHGLYHYSLEPRQAIVLAPLAEPSSDEARGLLGPGEPVLVPEAEVPEFLEHYVPRLRRTIALSSTDGAVVLPEIVPPVLVLTASFEPKQSLRLAWAWQYAPAQRLPIGGTSTALAAGRSLPATVANTGSVSTGSASSGSGNGGDVLRDERAERLILERVGAALAAAAEPERRAITAGALDELITPSIWPPRAQQLKEFDAALVTERALPVLESLDDVLVEIVGERPEYTELTGTPHISVTTVETEQRDWFDLGIVIHIGDYSIPFEPLFKALSKGRTKLLMVDHTYLSLEHPAFDRLRELLTEAAALTEWETKPSISRYQASLWADFEDLADETEQAVSWREAAAGLNAIDAVPDTPLPAGLQAELRPYQLEGFRWLAFLWEHGLGGILADDMGLGKTLQTLALVAHARETTGAPTPPFLVVAPTSVVSNWVAEAARFVPGLVVRSITATQAKGSASIAELADGADVVVTSYALFRLDATAYQASDWSGLILDEAQFVKNHRAKLHDCAVDLRAPFKLAITGTPIENTLMELWSLLSIVAPGLFASASRFTEHYVKPIGKGLDSSRLQTLRRRIRPLLMRRTKELVAPELPPKQEQVLRIELAPAHRKLYDLVLQRERQKLLGLVDDLDRNRFIVFRSLTLLRMLSLDASLIDPEAHAGIPSSKLDALLEQLDDVVAEGHRALIFSQFTSFLGIAARRLEEQGIAYEYLDGSTRRRGEVIDRFREGDAPVFLISLKAGGFGLNLTEADYVFLLDPWWNPAAEAQAIDRTHRIGQQQNVMVYRLVAADTIEEKVMALQAKKSELFAAVLDDDAVFSQALTAEDIRGLLE